jgi:hypothetical protein
VAKAPGFARLAPLRRPSMGGSGLPTDTPPGVAPATEHHRDPHGKPHGERHYRPKAGEVGQAAVAGESSTSVASRARRPTAQPGRTQERGREGSALRANPATQAPAPFDALQSAGAEPAFAGLASLCRSLKSRGRFDTRVRTTGFERDERRAMAGLRRVAGGRESEGR